MGPRLIRPSRRRRPDDGESPAASGSDGLGLSWAGQPAGSPSGGPAPRNAWALQRFASVTVGTGASKVLDAVREGSQDLRQRLQLPLWMPVPSTDGGKVGDNGKGAPAGKSSLMTVQDFFSYTQREGEMFFQELDADGDGRVTLEDVKRAMHKRNLPSYYARDFMNRVRRNRWWLSSVGWEDFKSLVDEREADMLRAFTSLELTSDGHLELNGIKGSLEKMGLPATDANAIAMMNTLETSPDGLITYGKFRNFLVLLPDEHYQQQDPTMTWFESATMLPLGPPMEEGKRKGAKLVATAALAGAFASGASTFVLHPLDTLKTRLQATVGASLGLGQLLRSVPQIGAVGLYRGIIPATIGAASAHGIRTGAQELTLMVLAVGGGAWELQATGIASAVGTLLGTACRIPCEVLKQRLQVGTHDNALEALKVATAGSSGVRGLFTGTVATLGREVPFYVLGMVGYEQLKKLFSGELLYGPGSAKELNSAQTIAIGALSGAMAAVLTTPADVMKTRIMTLPAGQSFSFGGMVLEIAQKEGFAAFFKGCIPRGLWIAPVGAMNFAGYELAKKAMLSKEGASKSAGPAKLPSSMSIRPVESGSGGGSNQSMD